MTYGVFMDDLPMVLGTEKLLMFQRKINRSEITKPYITGGKIAGWYREIRLGGREQVFQVFAEHGRMFSHTYAGWTGGGWGGVAGFTPRIDDACFVSNVNDNFLQLREDGWYLVVFNWRGDTKGDLATVRDFYVYCLTDQAAQTDQYGVNVYRPDGSLLYHSGWDLMRIRHRMNPKDFGLPEPFRIVPDRHREDIEGLAMHDFLSEQEGFYVGENKLVNIGFVLSADYNGDSGNYFKSRGRVNFTPVLYGGHLRLSMCHAYTGINFPHNFFGAGQKLNVGNFLLHNPIIVIDKPDIKTV